MTKTLGQVAYDAFGGAIKRDPPWSKLWVQERKWWQAAAEAVASEHERRALAPGVQVQLEGKVIEAAKAYINADVQTYDERRVALGDAVEALEEVERE